EWNGLDGAWTHRFLKEAEVLNPNDFETIKRKVDSERSKNGLQTYWEGISVKRTHVLGSLSLLDEAGKYNAEDLLSEGFSDSFPVDVPSTSKRAPDSKGLIPQRTKKVKIPNEDESLKSTEQQLQNAGDHNTPPPPYNSNKRNVGLNQHVLDDLEESDTEIDITQDNEEIRNLTEKKNIRNKLLAILTAQKKKNEHTIWKKLLSSICLNGILDFSDDEMRKKLKGL
ncbi:14508_t:CDS:2, partial [Acaulospora colombiana]